jgi:hypothetical protein
MKIPTGDRVVTNRRTSTGQVETMQTGQAVNNLTAVAGIVMKWKDQTDKSRVQEAINTATRRTNEWKAQNMTRTGKDADGLTEDYLRFSQELEGELSGSLSNNAREMFSQWSFETAESNKMSVISHQHRESQKVKEAAFNDGLTIAEETIRTDAKQWPKAMSHLENTLQLGLQSGVIREEEYETKRTDLTNRMRTELGKSYYTQDKHDFMKNINGFGFGKPEIEAYKQKYKSDLAAEERERKSLFNEEAKLLYGQRDDMKAQAIANGDTSHFFDGAKRLREMGYKDWANNLEEEGKLYTKVVEFNDQNKNKPLREIIESASALSVSDDLEGSSVDFKARKAIQAETLKQAKLFNSDPAEYVSKWAQGSTMEEIASSRMSLQEGQGVYPGKGYKVLTNTEKANFKGAWESGDLSQKTGLVMESFRYGKHTPRVLNEVGVNSSLALTPYLGDEKDVEMLVAGVAHKPELLDDNKKSAYAIENQDSKFYSHLLKVQAEFPTNEDLPNKLKDIDMAMTGISARKVDPSAGPKFFDEKFQVMDSGDKLVYFPNTVDEDEVEDFLDSKKKEIQSSIKTTDSRQSITAKWAMREAKWINTTSGFALFDSKSGLMIPGSEVELIEIDTLRKDMVKQKMAKASSSQDRTTKTNTRR